MIYAKETEVNARKILGNDVYDDIASKTGIPGGKGHQLYEQWRVLDPKSAKANAIAHESTEYYNSVRNRVRILDNIENNKSARKASNISGGLFTGEVSINHKGIHKLFTQRGFNESVIDNVFIGSGKAPFTVSRGFKGDEFFIDSSLNDYLAGKSASGLFIREKLPNSILHLDRQNLLALPASNNAFITQKAILAKDQILLRSKVRAQGGNKQPAVFGNRVLPGGEAQIITSGGVRSGAVKIMPGIEK